MNTHSLAQQLLIDEGMRLHAYQDSLGFWTIGVGRLIDQRKGGGITEAEAMGLLDNDIKSFWGQLVVKLPWVMQAPEAVQEVLVNLCFNLGLAGLLGFKQTLALLQAKEYDDAAREMLDSAWAKQVGQRVVRLAEQIANLEHGEA